MPYKTIPPELEELISRELNLPSPPAIAIQILSAVQNSESGMDELSRIITADPALTGKMLQIANSEFYALPAKITTIDRALTVLGTNIIKNIALSFVISTDMRAGGSSFDINRYWQHCVTAAVAAELLSKLLGQKNEDIFVTTLLHNIGMLMLSLNKHADYGRMLADAPFSDQLIDSERAELNYDHQQVGALLIASWGLPQRVYQPIQYHHNPWDAPAEFQQNAWLIYFASRSASIYIGEESAEKARIVQEELKQHYQLEDNCVRELLDNIAVKSIDILKMFEIDAAEVKPYSQLLQEANEQLGKLNLSYEQLVIELKQAKEKSERLARELGEANTRLNNLVYTDALTGLYNHRYFQQSLEIELARAQRYNFSVSLIIFDVDHFKKVNDTYGHQGGDQVLSNLAKTIKDTVRPSDIVARYGGEEFAVILPQTDIAGLRVFAARIRRCVEGVITDYEDNKIMVTISLGGTTFSPDQAGISKDALFETADRALYMSKNNGRNQATILATENAPTDMIK